MTKQEKQKEIELRKEQLACERGLTCEDEINQAVLDSFLEEFFFGMISRGELEEYASLMGFELHLDFVDNKPKKGNIHLC